MPWNPRQPNITNASHFYQTIINTHCAIYHSSHSNPISITSFEDALNPNHYQKTSQPFALIITNPSTNEFLLVRDHLGVHPLFYSYDNQSNQLIFGDTIPDILQQLPQIPTLQDLDIPYLFSDVRQYTDKTIYPPIYRVEPGHMMHYKPNGQYTKSAFWQLEPSGETLYYQDEHEYLEHFKSLMQASIQHATQGSDSIAAEFSAGMDSSAVYGTCAELGLNPTLFMNAPLPESDSALSYNNSYEQAFEARYPDTTIHRIVADNFDAIRIFKKYSAWFAGAVPHIFELFYHPLHRAVSDQKHTILLSGLGGDQGISSHIPTRFILPELIQQKKIRQAWTELTYHRKPFLKQLFLLIQYTHPFLYQYISQLKKKQAKPKHPYFSQYFETLRESEWSFLQGPNSGSMRMRIECSSIVAKKMGFQYRYPLLHPELLEFFLSLPVTQKRHHGVGRHLIRRYVNEIMPMASFDTHQKKEGLGIAPAIIDTFKHNLEAGRFQSEFKNLPFSDLIQDSSPHKAMIKKIQAFMLKTYFKL